MQLKQRWINCIGLLGLMTCCKSQAIPEQAASSAAVPIENRLETPFFLPSAAESVRWLFSGTLKNEYGHSYAYFFSLQRRQEHLQLQLAFFDAENQSILFFDDQTADLKQDQGLRWQLGHSYLNYDSITGSWILGFKGARKIGFNLKIDLLKQANIKAAKQHLKPGLEFLLMQSGRINGHLQLPGQPEQFLTASNSWFSQTTELSGTKASDGMQGLFCHFKDGSGLYSVKLPSHDALQASMSGPFDQLGMPKILSQFLDIRNEGHGYWMVESKATHWQLRFQQNWNKGPLVLGFVKAKDNPGFCSLNRSSG